MAKPKKKKPLLPRVKRMKRPARLESAKEWILTYSGKHLLRGYCNHYAVTWRCAAIELKILGIEIDPNYLATRERADAELVRQLQAKKEERKSLQNQHWHPFTDAYSAFLTGDFEAMHDLQMREEHGDGWETLTLSSAQVASLQRKVPYNRRLSCRKTSKEDSVSIDVTNFKSSRIDGSIPSEPFVGSHYFR